MAYPRDQGTFILDTDASDSAVGAVLSQIQDGEEKVISYGCRTLNRAESNYCVIDKEFLAIRCFTEYYRQYHQALIWLFKLQEPNDRIARLNEVLSQFDFTVEYRPGAKHQNADAIFSICNPRDCTCSNEGMQETLKCGPCSKCRKRTICS